ALPEPAQRMLAAAAVAGSRVDHELLAAATGQGDGQLVPLLREALARHLLAVDEASGGYVFRHALVQEAVYGELLPAQRGPLHAAYARALDRRIERRGAGTSAGVAAVELAQLAYHWHAAGDQGTCGCGKVTSPPRRRTSGRSSRSRRRRWTRSAPPR